MKHRNSPVRLAIGSLLAAVLLAGAFAGNAAALTPYVVTISSTATSGGLGTSYTIAGSVPNAAPGRTVYLDEFSSGAWRQRFAVRTIANRTYQFPRQRPTRAGVYAYRVRTPGSSVHSAAVSKTVVVSIFRWIKLTEYNPISGFANSSPDTQLGGNPYFAKYWFLTPSELTGTATYDLKKRCTNFRVTIGVGEAGAPGSPSAAMRVGLDSTTVFSQVVRRGDALYRMYPLTNRSRLTIAARAVSYNTSGYVEAAFGGPEIRCSF